MKQPKTVFICTECGYKTSKWLGKCPTCGEYNTLEEETELPPVPVGRRLPVSPGSSAVRISELEISDYIRTVTGMGELDRVLGGGLVNGSVVLLSGEPGIGKSTLLLQISEALGKENSVLYVSGEESASQLKYRAKRLGVDCENLYIMTETNIEHILNETDRISPDILIVDSIQTMYSTQSPSTPGSVTQVKESAMQFMYRAKGEGTSIILVGHVNKEGGIAGPKVLEHMVDAVLYFEGDRQSSYRIIRAEKNRYGSTNEIGVFEMTDRGLRQIDNPSEMLLSGRPKNVSGNCAVCVMEGTRPIITEIQALVAKTIFPAPKRASNGIDYNRMFLLLAVLEKRLGLRFSANDAYLNVVGGLRLDEPAADLAIVLSLASGIKDKPCPDDVIAVGEVGLSGECRAVSSIEQRIREAERLGFGKIVIPSGNFDKRAAYGIKVIPVKSIYEAINNPDIIS